MDFGKLFNINHVNFELPAEDPRTSSVLNRSTRAPSFSIYVGGPVWTCPKWMGTVYPQRTPARDYLRAYSQQFNSVELNSSFYRIPDLNQVKKWTAMVPADFKFAPKLHQSISHLQDFSTAKANLKFFWENVRHFEQNLGICFLQLPPHFSLQNWRMLKNLLQEFPDRGRLAVEFRHPSWFVHGTLHSTVFDLLQEQGISTVITDVAGRRDVAHSSLTTRKVLIRFTGNELHPSDYTRIESWVTRIGSWVDRGIEEIYFFIHQPTEAEVPELSRSFTQSLNARCNIFVRSYIPIKEPKPHQDPQLTLFPT